MSSAWPILVAAIGIEVCATSALPRSQGFRDPFWTAVVLVGYALSIWLLSLAVQHISVPVAYAVWAGLGTAGVAVVGVLFLDEPLDAVKVGALAMIIAGVVLLNLRGAH
jgi:small multidrug resistance pump